MEDFKAVIDTCLRCMSFRLHFGTFNFTFMEMGIAVMVLGIVTGFIRKIFDN